MSRPQRVLTDDILRTGYELIMAHGPRQLTFSRLGQELGLVPAALVKRFKNKQQLLAAIDRYALERSNQAMVVALEQHNSPIEAIIALVVAELSFATSIEKFVNGQSFLLLDFSEPELYVNYRISFDQRHQHIADLLMQAQERGIIKPHVDCDELARLLEAVQHGLGHLWAMTQKASIATYMDHYIRLALQPYMLDDS